MKEATPLRSGHVEEAATSLRSRRQVVKSTHSLLGNRQCVYDVWVMTGLKDNRRIAERSTLKAAHEVITPEMKREYVYILEWTPVTESVTHEVDTFGPNGRFGTLQGQYRVPQATPTCKYIWGCLCNRAHTNDLRDQVRRILRSN